MDLRSEPKFIQIAIDSFEGATRGYVYALDEDGMVWMYRERDSVWVELSARRETPLSRIDSNGPRARDV